MDMRSTTGIKLEVRAAEILWALGSETLWPLPLASSVTSNSVFTLTLSVKGSHDNGSSL